MARKAACAGVATGIASPCAASVKQLRAVAGAGRADRQRGLRGPGKGGIGARQGDVETLGIGREVNRDPAEIGVGQGGADRPGSGAGLRRAARLDQPVDQRGKVLTGG